MFEELDENDENFYAIATSAFQVSKINDLVEDEFQILISNIGTNFKKVRSFHRFKHDNNPTNKKEDTATINGNFKFYFDEKRHCEVSISLGEPRTSFKNDNNRLLSYSIEQPERPIYSKILLICFYSIAFISLGIIIWLVFRHRKDKREQMIAPVQKALRQAISKTYNVQGT